jgi:hypothetical protein
MYHNSIIIKLGAHTPPQYLFLISFILRTLCAYYKYNYIYENRIL